MPLRNIRGMKTAQVTRTDDIRGVMTSLVPLTQASVSERPLSIHCVMFSIITIELSIIIPIPSISPASEMIFIDNPVR